MTKREVESKKTKSEHQGIAGRIIFCLLTLALLALGFLYSEVAISSMSHGLLLCVTTVIPSLFPFMVLSELFISSGAAELLGKILGRPLAHLFGISPEGALAVLLGFICGFPIGSKCALSLYRRGRISKQELEHLTVFCNNPSSAFLISAVGVGIFGSKRFGLLLYAAHLVSAMLIGMVSGIYYRKFPTSQKSNAQNTHSGFVSAFSDAVTGSASSMLYICAFVVFFSVLGGYITLLCDSLDVPALFRVLLCGFFEMTGGVSAASALPLYLAAPICALLCGWSGLSVHFQLVGICQGEDISLLPYILGKLASAALCFAFVFGVLALFGSYFPLTSVFESTSFLPPTLPSPIKLISTTLFFASCGALYKKNKL